MGNTVTAASATGQTFSGTTKSSSKDLDVNDFFNLLAAQLKNQTMLNPVDDTQLISQMAQFSALSSTQQLNSTFSSFLSVSYIGKNVKAELTDSSGNTQKIEGLAQKVEFISGQTYITVNGVRVTPESIVEVTAPVVEEEAETIPETKTETTTETKAETTV
jgi:flagellar basal-body rod modification protein FlgD